MKLYLLYLLSISVMLMLFVWSVDVNAQAISSSRMKTVVIDAGHGGTASGCVAAGIQEKHITLKLALLFGEMINKNLPDVKVIYTRTKDVSVDLAERAKIANKANADLFISIHVDSHTTSTPTGSTTLVMGMDKLGANLDIAMKENDVVMYEKDYQTKYEGYVPGSAESYIIFSLMQYAYLEQSITFANLVQKHYGKNTPIVTRRGVKQQPLIVLWKSAMPSILTEVGFMSNPTDRKFLTSEIGQQKIARSLFNAFSEYKAKVEGNSNIVLLTEDADMQTAKSQLEAQELSELQQPDNKTKETTVGKGIVFMVQIAASTKKIDVRRESLFSQYKNRVEEKKIGNLYKYYIDKTNSFKELSATQKELAKKFKGAFIVAFKDGKQIAITEDLKKL